MDLLYRVKTLWAALLLIITPGLLSISLFPAIAIFI